MIYLRFYNWICASLQTRTPNTPLFINRNLVLYIICLALLVVTFDYGLAQNAIQLKPKTEKPNTKVGPENLRKSSPDDRQLLKTIESLIAKIDKDLEKSRILRSFARLQALNGDRKTSEITFRQAAKAMDRAQFPESSPKIIEYERHIEAMLSVGFCEEPLRIVRLIQGDRAEDAGVTGDSTLLAIASRLAKQGRNKEALALKKKVVTKDHEDWVTVAVGVAQAEIGDFPGALGSVKTISDDRARFAVLVGGNPRYKKGIAQHQADHGDLAGALKTIEKAVALIDESNQRDRDYHRGRIAIAQARIGDWKNALQLLKTIRMDTWKDSALQGIAIARANDGDWMGSAKIMNMIQDPNQQLFVLPKIAMAQHKEGLHAASKKTLERAFNSARRLMKDSKTTGDADGERIAREAFAQIVLAQAKSGAFHDSLTTALSYAPEIPSLLLHIATTEAELGDIKAALSTINLMNPDLFEKSQALFLVARQQAFFGDEHPILAWVEKQESPYYKAIALIGLFSGRKITQQTNQVGLFAEKGTKKVRI